MCGITIYQGIPIKIKEIWDTMLNIKNRGEEDGFGYIDITNNKIVKSIFSLEEIEKVKIDEKRKFKHNEKEKAINRIKEIKNNMLSKTEFLVLHNRKASTGSVCLENTHPIKINKNIYYIHNGSISGFETLKKFIEIIDGNKFHTKTDSELLGWFVENEINKKTSIEEIYKKLTSIFIYGFGVLVRVDKKNKEITIFKDTDRTLYLYKCKGSNLIISEPINTLLTFNSCIRLDKGIILLKNNKINISLCDSKDITETLRQAFIKEVREFTCDNCKGKGNTRNTWDNKDYCLACITSGIDLKKKEKGTDTRTTTSIDGLTTITTVYDNGYWKRNYNSYSEYCGK